MEESSKDERGGGSRAERPQLAVIVPVYNERECLPELHRRLGELRERSSWFDLSVVYVDDGSADGSRILLTELDRDHDWVTTVLLARNFGHQIAVTAGLDVAVGTHVAIIDSDLQDPPELLDPMLRQLIDHDVQVVYGRRRERPGETWFKTWTAGAFYRAIRWMSGIDIPMDTGDFRVMGREAADALRSMREHNRFLRGMVPWMGYRSEPYFYDREARFAGDTKYPLKRMLAFAANAMFSFSVMPIRLVQALGFFMFGLGAAGGLVTAICATFMSWPSGIWALIWVNLVLAGLVVASVGVVGGYVHRIQDEVRGRPLYLVEKPAPRLVVNVADAPVAAPLVAAESSMPPPVEPAPTTEAVPGLSEPGRLSIAGGQ